MNPPNNDLNRRKFLSTVTTAAGFLAFGLTSTAPAALAQEFQPNGISKTGKRVGISDDAFKKARQRAEELVRQMTLEEKIGQLGAQAVAVDRLNVPGYNYYTGEALHGVCRGAPVTSFPVPLALAASWNPELFLKVYTVVSDEARAYDNRDKNGLSYYSPITLNLHRDPRWGRCSEAPGEDPCLAATIGVQVIRGMQGDNPNYLKTTACSKHFICNNTDNDRTWVSAPVDARSLWEYYTRAECAMILEADVFSVMSAYSAMNGIPCSASRFLLTDLLRRRWGFRGYVTSDCDAIDNIFDPHHYAASLPIASAMAVSAGCDLNCGGTLQANLKEAVDHELISEDEISTAVVRLMTVRYLMGLFDPPADVPYTKIPFEVVDSDAHRALALEAARQSLVLLKNDSQFLPLDKTSIKKIAVIGPLAGLCQLGGYSGAPIVRISPYEGIANQLGVEVFHPNVSVASKVATSDNIRLESSSEGESNIGFVENNAWAEFPKMNFDGKSEFEARVSSFSDGGRIEVHLDSLEGPLACTLTVPHTGAWQNWTNVAGPLQDISGEHSIFMRFLGGSGWLLNVERFQLNPVVTPPPQPGKPQVIFAQGCTATGKKDSKMFQEAVAAAQDADVVVLVCGVTEDVDREGVDREKLGLPGVQGELTQAIYAVNPKTVLVVSSNNSAAIEWEQQNLLAIVGAVCAGQSQGTAIADVLFGDYNPGGKLPCTWYRSEEQLPPMHDYDVHKGRTYMYFGGDPLYPFGHGLSFTTFSLGQLQSDAANLGPGGKVSVSANVKNTGNRAGAEVVQLYITPPSSPVKRPIKQLAGFKRVELQPGEQKTVTFELPYTEPAFWYWDDGARKFACQPGVAKILIGNSSANILLTGELTLQEANMAANTVPTGPEMLETVAVKSSVA